MSAADNVKVAVRVRPFNSREKGMKCFNIISMNGPQTTIKHPEGEKKPRTFTFDYSYDSFVPRDDPTYASQGKLWDDIGVGVLSNAYKGYNCSLFAYGQTGAGKSYSMMGYGPDKGIIPIASEKIFDRISSNEDPHLTFRVETSMLEIYMEKVRDLFNPKRGENLKIRNNPKTGFYVENLTKNAVADYHMVEKLMETGSKARTVASTNMNATSSRAHTIFKIMLTQTRVNKEAGTATDTKSAINLIDLAGSERQSGTGATGARLKEGSAINLSLSSLGNCIAALAHNASHKKQRRVPYRASALTMLLKTSLGGNAKTIMIAAVSPASVNYDETLSTLKYADRAKQIKNKAVVNEDPNQQLIRKLRGEVEELRKMLAAAGVDGQPAPNMDGMLEKEKEEMRAKLEAEKAAEVARLKAEFEAKMQKELEDQWKERLAETEGNNDRNMAELAAQGVTAGTVTEEMKEKAATVPHIVNLNEDKQLNANIMYFFENGVDTKFGRVDAEVEQDIKLRGLSIEKQHAYVSNDGASLVLHPIGTAKTRLNGELVNEPKPLNHHDRLIFGNNHVFLVIVPGAETKMEEDEEPPDWDFAVREMNKAQVQMMAEQEAKRKAAAEAAQRQADERVREIEAKLEEERQKAEAEAEQRRKYFEEREKQLAEEAAKMQAQAAEAANSQALAEQLAEQEARLKSEQEEAARRFAEEQAQMKQRAEELERKLQEQIKETERQARKQQREIRERSLLDEKLLKTIPLVNEANAISDELQRNMAFSVKLMANPNRQRKSYRIDSDDEDEDDDDTDHLDTEVYVRVEFTDNSQPVTMWEYEKFVDRLFLMRELYTNFVECGRNLGAALQTVDKDPFFVKQGAQVIGRSTIYLDSLLYVLSIEESTPIIDYKGKEEGELKLRIVPHLSAEPPATEEDEEDIAEKIQDLYGQELGITVFIDSARGLPQTRNTNVYVRYAFFLDEESHQTEPCKYRTINPSIKYQKTHRLTVTEEFKKYVEKEGIVFEVYGSQDATAERPPTAQVGGALGAAAVAAGPSREELEAMRENLTTAQNNVHEAQRKVELLERERASMEEQKAALERETHELRAKYNKIVEQGAGAQAQMPTPVATGNDEKSKELARQLEAVRKQKLQADEEMAAMRAQLEKQKQELADAKSGACTIL